MKEHLDKLIFVLMALHDFYVKMGDEDLAMIWLTFLPSSYENFVSFLSIGKDSITLEHIKSSLYSWELRLKAYGNGDEASMARLSVIGRGLFKESKEERQRWQDCKESNNWKGTIQRKQRKIMLLLLFRMTPHWKVIWF